MLKGKLVKENKLNEWMSQCVKKIEKINDIYIWGAARGGAKLIEFLTRNNMLDKNIVFIDNSKDKQGKTYYGKQVCNPDVLQENVEPNSVILITCADSNSVIKQIQSMNLKTKYVVEVFDFAWVDFDNSYYDFIWNHYSSFNDVYMMLGDEVSKEVFAGVMNYKMTKDMKYTDKIKDNYGSQYFDDSLFSMNSHESFVDCGAYIGDSLSEFISAVSGKYEAAYCFEPDKRNYSKLQSYISDNELTNVTAYNLAASDKKCKLFFELDEFNGASSSHTSDSGNYEVEADSLDNVLCGKRVSLIKIDVEGAEESVLKGAQRIIREQHPVLTVCAYHKKEDFYNLPLLIKSIYPNYKFYFRHYSNTDFETLIYAIPND